MRDERELRSRLGATPPTVPSFRTDLAEVLRRGRSRRLRRSIIGWAATAALLLGGLGLPLALLSGLHGQPPPVAPSPSQVKAVLAATISVPGAVDVTAGDGSVWVSGFGFVSRIDPWTDRVVARVATKGVEDFSQVAVGLGAVWVTADRGILYRIDPATNSLVATIRVPGVIDGVETAAGYVWVTDEAYGTIVRVDPATNQVAGRAIGVGPGPLRILYAFGALWVANTSPASVVRVDPSSGEVTTQTWASDLPGWLAAGYGSIWEASGADSVIRADPQTGRTLATIPIPRASLVAIGEGRVWVVGRPRSSRPNLFYPIKGTAALWQIDPSTDQVVGDPVPLEGLQPIALAADDGAVWVADYNGQTVTRFDVVPCEGSSCNGSAQIRKVELPAGLTADRVAVGQGAIWVGSSTGDRRSGTVVRIDPATDRIVATVPVDQDPWYLAAGAGALWVGSPNSTTVQRLDAQTNQVTAQIQVPGDTVGAIAADDQGVWVEAIQDRSNQGLSNRALLIRIDPATNQIVAQIPLEGLTGYDDQIAIGAASVWVVGVSYWGHAERGSDVIRVDPATNQVVARIPGPAFSLGAGDDVVWVTAPADGVNDSLHKPEPWIARSIDPATDQIAAPLPLPGSGRAVLAVTADGAWFSGYDRSGEIQPIQVEDGGIDTPVPSIDSVFTGVAFDPSTRTIWVASVDGLLRIDVG